LSYLYLDTSAVVKRYAVEPGSNWLRNLLDPTNRNTVVLAEITLAEFAAAISAKHRAETISSADRTDILNLFLHHCDTEYQLTATNRAVLDRAVALVQSQPLRGYDGVQLATGLSSRDVLATIGITDFIFVSADHNLLAAASAEGLVVDNPNNYS